jgi:hypothetical protein
MQHNNEYPDANWLIPVDVRMQLLPLSFFSTPILDCVNASDVSETPLVRLKQGSGNCPTPDDFETGPIYIRSSNDLSASFSMSSFIPCKAVSFLSAVAQVPLPLA